MKHFYVDERTHRIAKSNAAFLGVELKEYLKSLVLDADEKLRKEKKR